MTKSIYNVYVPIDSQEQADRMKQLCLNYGLPLWDDEYAFEYYGHEKYNLFEFDDKEFYVCTPNESYVESSYRIQVTEEEFIDLLKNEKTRH